MKVLFTPDAWDDYLWVQENSDYLSKVNALIKDAQRSPFTGIGKPEPLKRELAGWWSRRITQEHRLVYRVVSSGAEQQLQIASCRYHY